MYGPATASKDRHLQMANHPILREMSKPLPAFPHGQTGCLVQARWLRMNELNPSLSHRVLDLIEKLLWLGENSIFFNALTHHAFMAALWVLTSGFLELEQPLDIKVIFKSAFQLSIFSTTRAVQWWEAVLFVMGWHYSCFMDFISAAKVYGRGVPVAYLAPSAVRLGNSLFFIIRVFTGLTNCQVKSYSSRRKSF